MKEQLLMLECVLLVQQSTLLNNSVLAAADALINWKGWVAQDAAEAVWYQRLGMEWKKGCFKQALEDDHYLLCHCYFFLKNHGAKFIFWAAAVSPWVCICPQLSCSDHTQPLCLKAMKLETPKSRHSPVPFPGREATAWTSASWELLGPPEAALTCTLCLCPSALTLPGLFPKQPPALSSSLQPLRPQGQSCSPGNVLARPFPQPAVLGTADIDVCPW